MPHLLQGDEDTKCECWVRPAAPEARGREEVG